MATLNQGILAAYFFGSNPQDELGIWNFAVQQNPSWYDW